MSWIKKMLKDVRVGVVLQVAAGLLFAAVGLTFVLLSRQHMRDQALEEARSKARLLLDRNLATHTYFTHQLKPELFEWSEGFRDEDYFNPTWMSSTYAVREMHKYFESLSETDYYYKECAIDARSPQNEADPYERAFLEELNADPELTERSLVRTLEGEPMFVTLRRGEAMEASCLRCHSTPDEAPEGLVDVYGPERSFDREAGEVVSAISIRVPLVQAYGDADRFAWSLSLTLLGLLVVLFLAQSWLTQNFLLRPLARVRRTALEIAGRAEHLGEQIPLPAGAELRELTRSFNHMSRSLRESHDHLEARVEDRTAELTSTNQQLKEEIARRQRVEELLRDSRERLERIIQASPLPIFLISPKGIVKMWNPAAEELFGWTAEVVVGQALPIVGEEQADEFASLRRRVLEGESLQGVEIRRRNQEGEMLDLVLSAAAVHDASGEVTGIMSLLVDVTEEKRLERALRRSEERYRELVHSQGEGIGIVGPDERFRFANPAAHEIFGVPEGSLEGRSLRDFVDEETYEGIRRQTEQRRQGQTTSYEMRINTPDGEEHVLLVTATPRRDEDGAFSATFAVFRDITERKRMEKELERYSERLEEMVEERTRALREAQDRLLRREKMAALGQLAGSINHELRGPLGNLKSAAYFLDMVLDEPDEEVEETLSIIEESVERADGIVSSLLSFVRTEESRRQPVDVNALVEGVLTDEEIPADVKVAARMGDDLPPVEADPEQLRQVVRNLVSNAVEAMGADGRLTVTTAAAADGELESEQEIVISVSDTGEGIPQERQETIFEPLFSTKAKGVGLGLALVRMLVEAHGGTVEVESEVGEGSTFTVRLPVKAEGLGGSRHGGTGWADGG